MASPAGQPSIIRFGAFELDPATGELRKAGIPLKIHPQPFRLLLLLAERSGQIVTRDEIQHTLWGDNTFVDFERGINFCVNQIRAALADDADNPRFIETLPRRGYRFIASSAPIGPTKTPARGSAELDIHVFPHVDVPKQSPDFSPSAPPIAPGRSRGGWSARAVEMVGRRPMATLVTALALVLSSGFFAWLWTSPTPAPRVLRTVQLTHFGRVEGNIIVTDGPQIYFVVAAAGHYGLAQVSASGGEPVPIATPFPNVKLFDISPDHAELLVGSFIGAEDEMPLWTVPTSGGSPRRLGEAGGHDGAWSPDGQRVAYVRGSGLYLVDHDGSNSRQLAAVAGKPWQPRWSPDGRVLRFSLLDIRTDIYSIWEISAEGRRLHRLLPEWREAPTGGRDGDLNGDWTPDGTHFVFLSTRADHTSIWTIREKGGFLRRPPRLPALLTTSDLDLWNLVPARNGKSIFFVGSKDSLELARYDARLKQFVPYLAGTPAHWISFSRDGQWVAYVATNFTLWRSKLDGSELRRLTFPPLHAFYPRWSPDAKRIAIEATMPGNSHRVYLVSADGGAPEPLEIPAGKRATDRPTWSPDGNSIIIQAGLERAQHNAIYRVDLKTRKAVMLRGSEGLHVAEWSPDGRYVTAAAEDDRKLMLFDFQSDQWSELANGSVLITSFWSPDSRYLYWEDYGTVGEPVFRVRISDRKRECIATSKQLPWAADASYVLAGLTPDGSPLISIHRGTSDIYALDVDLP